MCVGEEKGVLSMVELILPANVVEACYNLDRDVHAYFMAASKQHGTSTMSLYKLKDDSVKIRVTVLAPGDEDEEESAPQPPTSRGGKRKKGPSGDGDDEPSTSRAKRKPDRDASPSTKKGKGRGKGVKDEEPTPAPSTPTMVELILPANVVEACYNLDRNVHAYFIAASNKHGTSTMSLYKLTDDSVKIRVTVLAPGDEDEEESAPQPSTPRGGKRKKGPSGDGDDEPSTSRAKRKPDGDASPSTKKGKCRGKGVKDEEPTPAPSTPTIRRAAAAATGVSPSPWRLRTAKTMRNVAKTAANLEDFIAEDGDFIEQTAVTQSGDQVLGSQTGAEPVGAVGGPGSMAEVQVAQQQMTGEQDEAMAEEMYGGEEDDEYVEIDPNTTASTVITVKKQSRLKKKRLQKGLETVRKVSMGRPCNWGKKTTLVYERKEKPLGKKGEGDQEEIESPKPTETVVIV